jgi:hypothetical protein
MAVSEQGAGRAGGACVYAGPRRERGPVPKVPRRFGRLCSQYTADRDVFGLKDLASPWMLRIDCYPYTAARHGAARRPPGHSVGKPCR